MDHKESKLNQKPTEEDPRESERKYRDLADSLPQTVAEIDIAGNITFTNLASFSMFGYTKEDFDKGLNIFQMIAPEERERTRENIQKLMKGQKHDGEEYAGVRKDGSRFPFTVYLTPVLRENKTVGFRTILIDVTERRRSEETLRATQVQLSEAMDLAHIVHWEFDPVTETFIFNDPFYALYGTTAELEGGYRMSRNEYVKRFIHPDDLPSFYRAVEQNVTRTGPEFLAQFEHRAIRRDGEVRHIMVRARMIKDEFGRILRRYGANQDITDRKKIEKALQESEEQFRKMFEGNPLGMVMVSSDFRFIRANAAFCRMLRYTEKELSSLTFKDITHPDHIAEDVRQVNDLMNEKIPVYQTEKRYVRKDKAVVWGSTRVNVMRDRDDRFLYFLTTVEDITQRKHSDEEQARLESQLFQSQKMEAVGTLAGGIAHDFNNLLTVIGGFTTLLRAGIKRNDPKKAYIDQILAASEKAAQLTQGLLAFSRKQQIALRPLDINSTIRATSKLLKRLLTEDIQLMLELSEDAGIIMADISQIDQILFNLASNARDAMRQGGTLVLETKPVKLDDDFIQAHGYGKSGEYVLLSVSDTGTGMDEETRSKVFDPFFTTKEIGKGTGLGLSTVYGIVKQHNGYIAVQSEPDKGTTFNIYLPVVDEIVREEEPGPRAPVKGGIETILVAEDSALVRSLITKMLNERGYTTIEAADGAGAVELFKKTHTVDLLLLDAVMPNKNGREAYEEMCKVNPNIKVIFTSGYTKDVFADKGVEDGKFNFLQKPITSDALLRKVREALDDNGDSC